MQMIRDLFTKHSGVEPPPIVPDVPSAAYGKFVLNQTALLADNLDVLSSAVTSDFPDRMENYKQA